MVGKNFFVTQTNLSNLSKKDLSSTAASVNPELFSNILNTTSAMLKSLSYSSNPLIENSFGKWSYDTPKCSGTLNHTGRYSGCAGQEANDNYNSVDRFNIAIGNVGIVPYYLNNGYELCYSGHGWCDFEFYLK
jgi:hypothetical protein